MSEPSTSTSLPVWHAGELQMQRSIGEAERMADVGSRVIRDHLIEQHREFYPLLSFVVLGAVDERGDAWATLRAGHPGFLHAPDPLSLRVATASDHGDPAESGFGDGASVGLLGIDLATRRRNRLNGVIRGRSAQGFEIGVRQSYGNCPKYIRLRTTAFAREPAAPSPIPPQPLSTLDAAARAMIEGADAFFVASYVDGPCGRQVDVSHRGGRPGFVRVDEEGALTIPDFTGNHFFNTLGNFALNPKAGLVFADFASGDLLQLSGDAALLTDSPERAVFRGAERLWRFQPRRILRRCAALPLRWADVPNGESPFLANTSRWQELEPSAVETRPPG